MRMPWVLALLILAFVTGQLVANIGEPRCFDVSWGQVATMWLWSAGFFVFGFKAGRIQE